MPKAARLRALMPASTRRPGVLGIVLTPRGKVVLVRHTYSSGWHPPGGGRKRGETAEAAVIRELREEIGLATWSSIQTLDAPEEPLEIFVFREAVYRPTWTIEIDEIAEFDPTRLPAETSPRLVRIVAALGLAERT